jgi:small conductance mechanosensitive channel
MDFKSYLEQAWQTILPSAFAILIIVVALLILLRLARFVLNRTFSAIAARREDGEAAKRLNTLRSVIGYGVTVGIVGVALMMIFDKLGINIGPVLAAAGIVGLAVGFGAQQLVQDIISGFFILIEDQIRVGDVVNIAGKGGLVEKVSLRMTVLRDLSGNVHYVRNGQIDVITNMTKDFSYWLLELGIDYGEDPDRVTEVMREVSAEMETDPEFGKDILEPIEVLGLNEFGDSSMVVAARLKTRPIRQWAVGREFRRRLKRAFDARGITIPFPQMTVSTRGLEQTQAAVHHRQMETSGA